jgi:hypothetical protein
MTHLMKSGKTCGLRDGHGGVCASPESVERKKKWTQDNRSVVNTQALDYYWRNRNDIRPRANENQNSRYRRLHDQAVSVYGDSCVCCGLTERLEIDHIFGAGNEHVRQCFKSHVDFYQWLIENEPFGFQILCRRCNVSKGTTDACRLNHG